MNDIIYCELLKLKRSKIVVIGILGTFIVPILVFISSIQRYLQNPDNPITLYGVYDGTIMFTMLLFAPLIVSIIATYIISREYSEKTLKTVFTIPLPRKKFLQGKFLVLFIIVMLFMLLSWFIILVLAIVCSFFLKVNISASVMIVSLLRMMYGGILVYMTVTLVVYLSLRTKGFVTPFIVVAVVCLLNVFLSGSQIAGFFPWSAAYILVGGHDGNYGCPSYVSFIIISLIFILSINGSMKHFLKEDIV